MAAISCWRRYARPDGCFSPSAEKAGDERSTRATDRRCAGQSPRSARRSCRRRPPPPKLPPPAIPSCVVLLAKYVVFRLRFAAGNQLHPHPSPGRSRPRSASRFRREQPGFPLQLSVLVGHFASAESLADDTRRVEGLRVPRTPVRVRSAGWAECVVSASGRHLQSARRQRSTSLVLRSHYRYTCPPRVERPRRRCSRPTAGRRRVRVAGRWYSLAAHAKEAEEAARQLRAPAMIRGRVDGLRELGARRATTRRGRFVSASDGADKRAFSSTPTPDGTFVRRAWVPIR